LYGDDEVRPFAHVITVEGEHGKRCVVSANSDNSDALECILDTLTVWEQSASQGWQPIGDAKGKCIFKVYVKGFGFHVVSGYAYSDGRLTNDASVDLAGDVVAFIPYPLDALPAPPTEEDSSDAR
jgi:hypothetical protein